MLAIRAFLTNTHKLVRAAVQIISSAPCDFSSRQCIGVSRQPFIMESSPSHPGISVMVGAAAMSSSSTPAWRAAPALRRHCRCGGRASVTSWRRRCHWFGSWTSTCSVVSPLVVSVSSRRHRRWSAAGLDDAAWCRRRPMLHHQLGVCRASEVKPGVMAFSSTPSTCFSTSARRRRGC